MQTRTPRHSERVWGDAGRVALARSYLLGWFAFSCYLQLHGLSVLFLYLIYVGCLYVGESPSPRRPGPGPRGRGGARGGAAGLRASAPRAAGAAHVSRMNGDSDT